MSNNEMITSWLKKDTKTKGKYGYITNLEWVEKEAKNFDTKGIKTKIVKWNKDNCKPMVALFYMNQNDNTNTQSNINNSYSSKYCSPKKNSTLDQHNSLKELLYD